MYILNHNFDFFKEFLSKIGVNNLIKPESKVQPDYRFTWRGKLFWIYSDTIGHEINGEDIDSLLNTWEKTIEMFEKEEDNG